MTYETVISGGTLVLPDREIRADLGIDDGKIAVIAAPGTISGAVGIDAAGKYVLPGVIDPHVHFNLGNGMADWETESRSAALGGVTTVLSYLMSGTSYTPLIAETKEVAARTSYIDYGLHLVPCSQTHLDELSQYVGDGVGSFKYFTSFRGDEGAYLGILGTDDGYLYSLMKQTAALPGTMLNMHPENIEVVWVLRKALQDAGRDDLSAWDEARPDFVEAECILRTMFFARQTGSPLYTVHLSGTAAIDAYKSMKKRYPDHPFYAETCSHYLTHTTEWERGNVGKVNPPLRGPGNPESLWEGLLDGTIHTVGSDHVPRKLEKKQGNIWKASAGFPGTACIAPVLLSEGVNKRGMSLSRFVELTAGNAARIFGIGERKGALAVGYDADVCIVDLEKEQVASAEVFGSYSDYSLYDGWNLKGWPVLTMLRGKVIMRDGSLTGEPGYGQFLHRG